jgi:hypothetical protein
MRGAYRLPEIEYMRAVAVVAVILHHLDLIAGGFIGVDIFFVRTNAQGVRRSPDTILQRERPGSDATAVQRGLPVQRGMERPLQG